MLIKASHEITKISDNDSINSSNYFESLTYINNLYFFINNIKKVISTKKITFQPTFRGIKTCEKFGLDSLECENEMKRFIISSELFLEDKELKDSIKLEMGKICETIIFDRDIIEFILR